MKTHKMIWSVIVALALVMPGLAKDKIVIESKWTPTPVKIDGSNEEWAQDTFTLNKDFDLSYAFKNDADFLYLLFVFNLTKQKGRPENRFMSSIDFTGLTLWINAEGKEKKTHGLRFYTKRVKPDELIQEMQKQGQTLTPEQIKEIQTKQPLYPLFVCDVVDKKGNPVPNQGARTATFRTNRTVLTSVIFEYQIPMVLLQDPASAVKWDPAQPFKLGFEWGGTTPEMLKNQGAMLGDRATQTQTGGGDLGAQLRSGAEGGGGGSRDFDAADRRRQLPRKYDFWIDLKIAPKQ